MAVSQSLTLTEVSYSAYYNTSDVRIVWKSTQTGSSYTDYGVPGFYYVSINGGAESTHEISAKQLHPEMTVTLLDTTITVPHKDDGTGSISVRTWMNTNIDQGIYTNSESLTLTTIARASAIDSVSNQNLGVACSVKWTPKSTSFRYKLKFSMGDWSKTIGPLHPNQPIQYTYSGYTIPLEVAEQIPNSKTGRMTVTLYTYRDSNATNQVGSESSETFTVTVPENESTKPSLTMSLSPRDTLDSAFDGLYVQGRSQVTANLSGSGKYGATIFSYGMTVDGIGYDSTLESEYLSTSGDIEVVCKVKDTRGFTTEKKQTITVIPYSKPKLVRASDESSIICDRCDISGNLKEDGTSLKIKVGRSYSKVVSGDTQKNFCTIRYRCKLSGGASFTDDDWKTLLLGTDLTTDYVDTVIKNLVPQVNRSYIVEISAIDGIDETSLVCYVATDEVVFHLGEDVDGVAFGKYAEKDKVLEIAPEWDIYYKGDKIDKMFHSDTGWISLTTSGNATSSSNITRSGEGCFYKVINGNHVYVAFNCGFAYSGETVHINTDTIPEAYRPKNNAYTLCPCDNRTIARVYVASDGYIYIGYVQDMASGTSTSSYTAGWIDGYIDYWI